MDGDDNGYETHVHRLAKLRVMMKNGARRHARNLFEWVQQYVIEQCAASIALRDAGKPDDVVPCQLGDADGYSPPPRVDRLGRWWTRGPVYASLVRRRRRCEMDVRLARLAEAHVPGLQVLRGTFFGEPWYARYLLAPWASFPCAPERLGEFLLDFQDGVGDDWELNAGNDNPEPLELNAAHLECAHVMTYLGDDSAIIAGYALTTKADDDSAYWYHRATCPDNW